MSGLEKRLKFALKAGGRCYARLAWREYCDGGRKIFSLLAFQLATMSVMSRIAAVNIALPLAN